MPISTRNAQTTELDLFQSTLSQNPGLVDPVFTPLAERMRPQHLDEIVGQNKWLGLGQPLRKAIESGRIRSLILWGPPGTGKTTFARVLASATHKRFIPLSAVLANVAEVRALIESAKEARAYRSQQTILFVDEIHRFNKAQQDAFLPHVEDGTITLVGATTENPSFAVNAALLSRCRVIRLEPLHINALVLLLRRALLDTKRGLGQLEMTVDDDALESIATLAQGDARRALTLLETTVDVLTSNSPPYHLTCEILASIQNTAHLRYDKKGDDHYGVTSAFIKSMRGSDPNAALYYMARMLEAGEDPLFVLRRLMIFASEDIGNADPRALLVAVAADEAFRRMGMPEGIHPLAQACTYLATAPKSNASIAGYMSAKKVVEEFGSLDVPLHLRPASTALNRSEHFGKDYIYTHDEQGAFSPTQIYLPDLIKDDLYYQPKGAGYEAQIVARMNHWAQARSNAKRETNEH